MVITESETNRKEIDFKIFLLQEKVFLSSTIRRQFYFFFRMRRERKPLGMLEDVLSQLLIRNRRHVSNPPPLPPFPYNSSFKIV